jgi:hypothetical protein
MTIAGRFDRFGAPAGNVRFLRTPAVRCVVDRDSIPQLQTIPPGSSGSLARGGSREVKVGGTPSLAKGSLPSALPLPQNNRAENSHQPTRRRERKMQRCKSPGSAQRFLFTYAAVQNTFNVRRHLTCRRTLGVLRDVAYRTWLAATVA